MCRERENPAFQFSASLFSGYGGVSYIRIPTADYAYMAGGAGLYTPVLALYMCIRRARTLGFLFSFYPSPPSPLPPSTATTAARGDTHCLSHEYIYTRAVCMCLYVVRACRRVNVISGVYIYTDTQGRRQSALAVLARPRSDLHIHTLLLLLLLPLLAPLFPSLSLSRVPL